ncbi:facilitated trehalose transporter Tret1-like [Ochlerotatus camptorhynchus]|uniref:facilitated trehalose transporter Tret1-like n=1 Tax=Ochlerotatus camptorhynchus TaxID=644619 RepID=UPI0031D5AB47
MGLRRSVDAENFPFKSVLNQFLGAIAVNIITISHGAAIGWVSPFLPYLQSSETHLTSGAVSIEQASWIGSLLCIGGLIGAPSFGLLADRFGKKVGLQLIVLPHVAFWLCILFGQNVYFIYLGRILAGSGGGGIFRAIPLYIADIAHCKLRGMLGSILVISLNIGILLGFVLGHFLSFFTVPVVMLAGPGLFIVCTCFLPETPYCLLKQNRNENAERSLMFYRGIRGHFQKTTDFTKEFEQLKKVVQNERASTDQHRLTWKDIFNIISLAQGTAIGWLSPFLPLLVSADAPLHTGPVTDVQATWIASLLCVGAIFGTVLFGWSADKFGRKFSLCIAAIPLIGFWACIAFGGYVEILYLGRLLAGLGAAGVFLLVPLYVTEIAEDSIRGSLGSFFILFINLGTFVSFVVGSYLSYHITSYILIVLPIVFLLCFINFPETPQHLIRCNKIEAAECSLKYLRGYTTSPEHVEMLKSEMITMINQVYPNGKDDSEELSIQLADFAPFATKKALLIGMVLVTLNQFSGCFALINYTANIFAEAGSDLDPNMAAIIVGGIQIIGSYVSTLVVDRFQRKVLYIATAFGSAIGLFAMGVHAYLKVSGYDVSAINWIPVASLSFVIFIAACGILPLTFVILSEILPQKLRSFGGSLCTTFLWVVSFIVIKYFPVMVEVLGMHGCMWTFAGCCLFGVFFNALFIPETRGKSIEEITLAMEGRSKN